MASTLLSGIPLSDDLYKLILSHHKWRKKLDTEKASYYHLYGHHFTNDGITPISVVWNGTLYETDLFVGRFDGHSQYDKFDFIAKANISPETEMDHYVYFRTGAQDELIFPSIYAYDKGMHPFLYEMTPYNTFFPSTDGEFRSVYKIERLTGGVGKTLRKCKSCPARPGKSDLTHEDDDIIYPSKRCMSFTRDVILYEYS